MKNSEIYIEAKKLINDLFYLVIKSEDKEIWKKAIKFIEEQTKNPKYIWTEQKFIWNTTLFIVSNLYWKKFILPWILANLKK